MLTLELEEAAFEALKKALTMALILQVFDEERPHEVWVDALDYAVGVLYKGVSSGQHFGLYHLI